MHNPNCEVCRSRRALYLCQQCGRGVCEVCIDTESWICDNCMAMSPRTTRYHPSPGGFWHENFQRLLLLGLIIIFAGVALLFLSSTVSIPTAGGSSGAIVLIGPVPLIFGFGPDSLAWVMLAVAAAIFTAVFLLTLHRLLR